ncbi:MAG: penicillin-binding transpeptidase domain-containing protein [Lachnospiraceae bacterium]|nr:penicillin-binding transpeptidase domain-containing protein [Lachnospiraceae bacterium]
MARGRRIRVRKQKFSPRMQKKLVLIFVLTILAFVVLIGRVTYINATRGSDFTRAVLDQQAFGSRIIPFRRGDIVDRNGITLATNERVYNVILDVYVMTSREQFVEPTVQVLADIFGINENHVRQIIADRPNSRYEILAHRVSFEMAREFNRFLEEEDTEYLVRGVWLEEGFLRIYPYGALAAELIGFTVDGNLGVMGIEQYYNDILNGTDGREYGFFATDSSLERTMQAPLNGHTVVSTIDLTVQSIVDRHVREFNETHANGYRMGEPGSKNTAVLVVDPRNGDILAMSSYPTFDLNNPRDLSAFYTEEELAVMSNEAQLDVLNALWRNFVVVDTFEPGSTVKPFTIAAGLETGALHEDAVFYCGGVLTVGDFDIQCWLRTGHGVVTMSDMIAQSCNVATMQMGMEIGFEDFTRYQTIFGFGQFTGIDLLGEPDTAGLIYHFADMMITDLATNAFGQNFNVTMIQMGAAFSSLINGGNLFVPRVVRQIQDESGRVIEARPPVLLRRTISDATLEMLADYLRATMVSGTGVTADVPGYEVGGKTGTAEKLPRDQGNHLTSFIGYAPLHNPEVLIYVVIDEPNVADQANGEYVRQLSYRIMSEIFPHLNIPQISDEGEIH